MKYTLYFMNQCPTCHEFIKMLNKSNVDFELKDIDETVGIERGKYRWEQLDLAREYNVSSFVPFMVIEDTEGNKSLFVGGVKGQEKENVVIFESHEDGVEKLKNILNL
jgi:glutaredoxin